MALYAQHVAYTPLAWAALLQNPEDRLETMRQVAERLGGTVVNGWLTFGDYDALVIYELPDNVSAAALSMAVSAGGAVKSVQTTSLLSVEDGIEAMRRAKTTEYAPPRSSIPYFGPEA
jgi:uncharacterized protein with GYD domain